MNGTRLPTHVMRLSRLRDGPLRDLLSHAQRLEQIERLLQRFLEPPLGEHCRVANLRQGRLLLQADASAWATRLRFQAPALIDRLRRALPGEPLKSVQVQVCPPATPARQARRASALLSTENAEALRAMAAGIADPGLKAALLRLSTHRRGTG